MRSTSWVGHRPPSHWFDPPDWSAGVPVAGQATVFSDGGTWAIDLAGKTVAAAGQVTVLRDRLTFGQGGLALAAAKPASGNRVDLSIGRRHGAVFRRHADAYGRQRHRSADPAGTYSTASFVLADDRHGATAIGVVHTLRMRPEMIGRNWLTTLWNRSSHAGGIRGGASRCAAILCERFPRVCGLPAMAFAAALAGSAVARAECKLGAVAVLPLHPAGGDLAFFATINGQQADLIFDTGAFATVIKPSSAARLGVQLSQLDSDSRGIGGFRHTFRGRARQMQVGNMNANGMMLAAMDMLDGPQDEAVDGLFGMNLMAAYDIDLDFVGQHAIILQAEGSCRTPAVALAQPLYDVPLTMIRNDAAADIDITIDGHSVRALIDSGAARTVMFRGPAGRFGVDMQGLRAPGHHESRGIGPFKVASITHLFDTVVIGNLTIHNMPIEIIDQAGTGVDRVHTGSRLVDSSDGEAGGEDLLLGADFMQKVHLWISHSSHRLIMQYPPQPSVLPQ